MPRWLWWLPLGVLTVVAGLLVFRLGWVRAHLSETDVITHYAAIYVAQGPEGAQMTDCEATPGAGDVWLIVRCGQGTGAMQFPVDRAGRLMVPSTVQEPQT